MSAVEAARPALETPVGAVQSSRVVAREAGSVRVAACANARASEEAVANRRALSGLQGWTRLDLARLEASGADCLLLGTRVVGA
jgi:hypothetical protein